MQITDLKNIQAPLKDRCRKEPQAALVTLRAGGSIGEGVTCSVETGRAIAKAGLHPASGGTGANLCSGDMLLEALVACAGVTLNAVATSLGLPVRDARVAARATSISVAPSASTRRGRSAPAQSASALSSMATSAATSWQLSSS